MLLQENGVSENTEELSREELGRLVASRWTGEKTEKQSGEGGAIANDDQGEDVPEYNHDDEEDRYATDTDDDSERYDTEKYDDNDVEDDIDETYREEDHDYTSTSYKTDVDDDLDMSGLQSLFPVNSLLLTLFYNFSCFSKADIIPSL